MFVILITYQNEKLRRSYVRRVIDSIAYSPVRPNTPINALDRETFNGGGEIQYSESQDATRKPHVTFVSPEILKMLTLDASEIKETSAGACGNTII